MAAHGSDHSVQQWIELTNVGVMAAAIEAAVDDSPFVRRRLVLGISGWSFEPAEERG